MTINILCFILGGMVGALLGLFIASTSQLNELAELGNKASRLEKENEMLLKQIANLKS